MLQKLVNKTYLKNSKILEIRKKFLVSKPYPNFALPNFFNKKKLKMLKKEILKEKFERQDKDLFSLGNTKELKYTNSRIIGEFYKLLSSREFIAMMMKLTGQKNLMGIDMHAHKMVQGDYLLFHDDVVEGRKIAYIAYLCNFKEKDGGRLQLFDIKNPRKPLVSIIPKFGTFACFEVSKKSLHVVEEVMGKKDRLSIGGWFYGN